MKIGALSFFTREHCNGKRINSWTIAALHWCWSLTWSWLLSYSMRCGGRLGPYFIRTNGGCIAGLNMGRLGSFFFQRQSTMPKRSADPTSDSP